MPTHIQLKAAKIKKMSPKLDVPGLVVGVDIAVVHREVVLDALVEVGPDRLRDRALGLVAVAPRAGAGAALEVAGAAPRGLKPENGTVKPSDQDHIGQFQARIGEGIALCPRMHTHTRLNAAQRVESGP